jgi:hypothetical protein
VLAGGVLEDSSLRLFVWGGGEEEIEPQMTRIKRIRGGEKRFNHRERREHKEDEEDR